MEPVPRQVRQESDDDGLLDIDVLAKGSPDQHAVNLRNADIEGPQHAHQTGVYGALGADQVLDVDLGQKDVFIAGGL